MDPMLLGACSTGQFKLGAWTGKDYSLSCYHDIVQSNVLHTDVHTAPCTLTAFSESTAASLPEVSACDSTHGRMIARRSA